jgi:hypothetical protein
MKPVWFAWAFLALASAGGASAAQRSFDVRLIEPAEHLQVVAGSTLPIAWEARDVPAGIEEWEAFVSVDGGRTYPMRITPHLDATIHRFNWVVPSLPGASLSILLRFGDEQDEREFPFAARMRITSALPLEVFRQASLRQTAVRRSAAEDDHGQILTEWIDGSRDGSDLRHVAVDESSLVADHTWSRQTDRDSTAAIGTHTPRADYAPVVSNARRDDVEASGNEARPLRRYAAAVLLLTGRLNI